MKTVSVPDGKSVACSSNSCITSRRRLSSTRRRDTLELLLGETGVRGDRGVRGEPNTPSSNSPATETQTHCVQCQLISASTAYYINTVSDVKR